jgi:hypothetical protein
MRRMIVMLTAVVALTFSAVPLIAHDDFRVIGTITKNQNSIIDVKDKNAKITSIQLSTLTVITRDDKKVDASALKVGGTVVVDATGDSEADLVALEIRIVPAIGATK